MCMFPLFRIYVRFLSNVQSTGWQRVMTAFRNAVQQCGTGFEDCCLGQLQG